MLLAVILVGLSVRLGEVKCAVHARKVSRVGYAGLVFPLLLLACTHTPHRTASVDTNPADSGLNGADSSGTDSSATDSSDGDTSASPAPVALWVWDDTIPGDDAATADLLAFSASHAVTTLFMTADPVGYGVDGAADRYASFVALAHANGLLVYAASGAPWFSVPCDAGLVGQDTCWTEGWNLYAACAASNVGFDGIMDDTEPASTPDGSFTTDYVERAGWEIAYLNGIRDRIGGLPLGVAIPSWYDTLAPFSVDASATSATLDVWTAETVDEVGVMAYRDTAAATLEQSATELTNGPIWIGMETGPDSEGADLTFADDGAAAVDAAMTAMNDSVGSDPNFVGFMVDSYQSWSTLR